MQLELVTLAGIKLHDEVYEVLLPTEEGVIAVFPQHMPLVTNLITGVITVRHKRSDLDEQRDIFATNGGVAEVTGKKLRVLVDEADAPEDIVEAEAREALEAARKLKLEAKDQVELEHAEALIDRHAVRLRVAELRRHAHHRRVDTSL